MPECGVGPPVLEAVDLVKDFVVPGAWPWSARRRQRAVDAASLTLRSGEILGLVGESGSGKSTLARLLVGLLAPTRGEVRLDGRALAAWGRTELAQRVQIVLQGPSLNPRLRVGEIVAEGLQAAGMRRAQQRERATAALCEVGLAEADLERRPPQLSGGQRQRVSLARALVMDPAVLVADEPTAALDASTQVQILALIQALVRSRRMALALVSHDLRAVLAFSDRIAVMAAGALVEVASRQRFADRPLHPVSRRLFDGCLEVDSAPLPPTRDASCQ